MGICVNRQPSQVERSNVPRHLAVTVKQDAVGKIEKEITELPSPPHAQDQHSQETKTFTAKALANTRVSEVEIELLHLYGNHLHIEGKPSTQSQTGFADKCVEIQSSNFSVEQMNKAGLSFACKKGLKPESPNQDDFFVTLDGNSVLMGVFDGHGSCGHNISDFVHRELPKLVLTHEAYETDPIQALASSFPRVHEQLKTHCEAADFDCILSGTTASVVLMRSNKVMVAHVGDSRVVLGRMEEGKWKARQLTVDHKPTIPEERERIERNGGEVKQLPGDVPYRVFGKDSDEPGLSMSRSIGDTMSQSLGVTCTAEELTLEISAEDQFLLLCSDGVWEFISSEEAVSLVSKFPRSQVRMATEKLAQLAWMRWLQHEEDTVDDITVILVFLPRP